MLVDDKLAKEKLARICEDEAALRRHRHDHPLEGDDPMVQAHKHVTAIKLAQLIRNTDLTDCQQDVVPVELWRGLRKVTVYPGENVLRSWGVNINHEMSDEPFSLEAVQKAMDWLYEPQKAKSDE